MYGYKCNKLTVFMMCYYVFTRPVLYCMAELALFWYTCDQSIKYGFSYN